MPRTFCILTAAEVEHEDFDFAPVMESAHSLRWNLAATETFVKWEGETPEAFGEKTLNTYAEIKEILLTPAWRAESLI